jgi:hypothetical protein
MTRQRVLVDRRLLGTWKSDRRKTFRHHIFPPKAKLASVRLIKAMFGKLVIRYGKRQFYTEFEGSEDWTRYEVVASDDASVVIRVFDEDLDPKRHGTETVRIRRLLFPKEKLVQIHFERKWYWVWTWGELYREYFRRVEE